jgi:hypothetical protein
MTTTDPSKPRPAPRRRSPEEGGSRADSSGITHEDRAAEEAEQSKLPARGKRKGEEESPRDSQSGAPDETDSDEP